MRIIYIADDGKEFNDKWDCEDYEWSLNHPHLKDILIYDKDGNELKNIFSVDTYDRAEKIVVPTDVVANDLRELAVYTGYCYYDHIVESGVWVFKKSGYDYRFELESKEV